MSLSSRDGVALLISAKTGLPIDVSLRSDVEGVFRADRRRSLVHLVSSASTLAVIAIMPWIFVAVWRLLNDSYFSIASNGAGMYLLGTLVALGLVHGGYFLLLWYLARYSSLDSIALLGLHSYLHVVIVSSVYGTIVLGSGLYRTDEYLRVQQGLRAQLDAETYKELVDATDPIVQFSHFPMSTVVLFITGLISTLLNTVPPLRLPPVEATYSHLVSILCWTALAAIHSWWHAGVFGGNVHPVWICVWVFYAFVGLVGVRMNSIHDTIRWTTLHLQQMRDKRAGDGSTMRIVLVEPSSCCDAAVGCITGVSGDFIAWNPSTAPYSSRTAPSGTKYVLSSSMSRPLPPGGARGGKRARAASGNWNLRQNARVLPAQAPVVASYWSTQGPTPSDAHAGNTSIASDNSKSKAVTPDRNRGRGQDRGRGTAPDSHTNSIYRTASKMTTGGSDRNYQSRQLPTAAALSASNHRYQRPPEVQSSVHSRAAGDKRPALSMSDPDPDLETGLLGTGRVKGIDKDGKPLPYNDDLEDAQGGSNRALKLSPRLCDYIRPSSSYLQKFKLWKHDNEDMTRLAIFVGDLESHLFNLPLVGLLQPGSEQGRYAAHGRQITRESVTFYDPRDIDEGHSLFSYLETARAAGSLTQGSHRHTQSEGKLYSTRYHSTFRSASVSYHGNDHPLRKDNGLRHSPFVSVPARDDQSGTELAFRTVGLGLVAALGDIFGGTSAGTARVTTSELAPYSIQVHRVRSYFSNGKYGLIPDGPEAGSSSIKSPSTAVVRLRYGSTGSAAGPISMYRYLSNGVTSTKQGGTGPYYHSATDYGDETDYWTAGSATPEKPAEDKNLPVWFERLSCGYLSKYARSQFDGAHPMKSRVGIMLANQTLLDTAQLVSNLSHPAFGTVISVDSGRRHSRVGTVVELCGGVQLSRVLYPGVVSLSPLRRHTLTDGMSFSLDRKNRLRVLHQVASGLAHLHSFEPPLVHGCLTTDSVHLYKDGAVTIVDLHIVALRLRMQGALQRLGLYLEHCTQRNHDPVGNIRSHSTASEWYIGGLDMSLIECPQFVQSYLPAGEAGLTERVASALYGSYIGSLSTPAAALDRSFGSSWTADKPIRSKTNSQKSEWVIAVGPQAKSSGSTRRLPVSKPEADLDPDKCVGVGTAVIANEPMKVQAEDGIADAGGKRSRLSNLFEVVQQVDTGHYLPIHLFDLPLPAQVNSSLQVLEKTLMKSSIEYSESGASSSETLCGSSGATKIHSARMFGACQLALLAKRSTRQQCLAPEVLAAAEHACGKSQDPEKDTSPPVSDRMHQFDTERDVFGFGTIMVEVALECTMEHLHTEVKRFQGNCSPSEALEVYSRRHPHQGISPAYIQLASDCLATNPLDRPRAADLVARLHAMSGDLRTVTRQDLGTAGAEGEPFFSINDQRSSLRNQGYVEPSMSRFDTSTMERSDTGPTMAQNSSRGRSPTKGKHPHLTRSGTAGPTLRGSRPRQFLSAVVEKQEEDSIASYPKRRAPDKQSPKNGKRDLVQYQPNSRIYVASWKSGASATSGRESFRRRVSSSALLARKPDPGPMGRLRQVKNGSSGRLPSLLRSAADSQSRPHDLDKFVEKVENELALMRCHVLQGSDFKTSKQIGAGSFATVFRGQLGSLSVAIKSFRPAPHGRGGSNQLQQLTKRISNALSEHGIVWRLSHPNIVRAYGWCIEGNNVSVLWQLCEVGTLKQALVKHQKYFEKLRETSTPREITIGTAPASASAPASGSASSDRRVKVADSVGRRVVGDLYASMGRGSAIPWLTLRTRIKLLHDVALAIEHMHRAGVIHRDIKPNNIFLTRQGSGAISAVLGDFGDAVFLPPSGLAYGLKGTIGYCAPEVFGLKRYGKSVDVYSFGATIAAMMSCAAPFMYDTRVVQAYFAILTKKERTGSYVNLEPDPTRHAGQMYRDNEGMRLVNSVSKRDVAMEDISKHRFNWSHIVRMVASATPLYYWIERSVRRGKITPQFKAIDPLYGEDEGDTSSIPGAHVWPGLLYGSGHNIYPSATVAARADASSDSGRRTVIRRLRRLAKNCMYNNPKDRPSAGTVVKSLKNILRSFIPTQEKLRQQDQAGNDVLQSFASRAVSGAGASGLYLGDVAGHSNVAAALSQLGSQGASGIRERASLSDGRTSMTRGKSQSMPYGLLSSGEIPAIEKPAMTPEITSQMMYCTGTGASLATVGLFHVRALLEGKYGHITRCPGEIVSFSMLVSRMILASLGPDTKDGQQAIMSRSSALVVEAEHNVDAAVRPYLVTSKMRRRWAPMGIDTAALGSYSKYTKSGSMLDVSSAALAELAWNLRAIKIEKEKNASHGPSIGGHSSPYATLGGARSSMASIKVKAKAFANDATAVMSGTVLPMDLYLLHPSVSAFVQFGGSIPIEISRSFGPEGASFWNPKGIPADDRMRSIQWGVVLDFMLRFTQSMQLTKEDYWVATALLLQCISVRLYRYLTPTRWQRTVIAALLIAHKIVDPKRPTSVDGIWPALIGVQLPLNWTLVRSPIWEVCSDDAIRSRIKRMMKLPESERTNSSDNATSATSLPRATGGAATGSTSGDRAGKGGGTASAGVEHEPLGDPADRASMAIKVLQQARENSCSTLFAPDMIETGGYTNLMQVFAHALSWGIQQDAAKIAAVPEFFKRILQADAEELDDELKSGLTIAPAEHADAQFLSEYPANLAKQQQKFIRYREYKQKESTDKSATGASHTGSMLYGSIGDSIFEADENESSDEDAKNSSDPFNSGASDVFGRGSGPLEDLGDGDEMMTLRRTLDGRVAVHSGSRHHPALQHSSGSDVAISSENGIISDAETDSKGARESPRKERMNSAESFDNANRAIGYATPQRVDRGDPLTPLRMDSYQTPMSSPGTSDGPSTGMRGRLPSTHGRANLHGAMNRGPAQALQTVPEKQMRVQGSHRGRFPGSGSGPRQPRGSLDFENSAEAPWMRSPGQVNGQERRLMPKPSGGVFDVTKTGATTSLEPDVGMHGAFVGLGGITREVEVDDGDEDDDGEADARASRYHTDEATATSGDSADSNMDRAAREVFD